MLEITISDGEKLLLEKAGYQNVISFCLLLSYGKIKNIENEEIRKIGKEKIFVKEKLKELEQIVQTNSKIRIWYASSDNEDFITLYFLICYLYSKENLEFYLCDVNDENHFSLGSYFPTEIKSLENKMKKLEWKEKLEILNDFKKLQEEDGDLRIIENNKLKSYPFSYLDEKILTILKEYDSVSYWEFVGRCMKERLCNFYGDIFFKTRIDELIKNNKIEIYKQKREQNIIGEWKIVTYIKISSERG